MTDKSKDGPDREQQLTKEARLAEAQTVNVHAPKMTHGERVWRESYDLGDFKAYRSCTNSQCSDFDIPHEILVTGQRTVKFASEGSSRDPQPSDRVELDWTFYAPADDADIVCPGCGRNVGFLEPGARNILAESNDAVLSVRSNRDAVRVAREKQHAPKASEPVWMRGEE